MMNRLAAMNRDAPKSFEIEQEALTNSRKKFTPKAKFQIGTGLQETANLFDNILSLKLIDDKYSRKHYSDLSSIDEFTAM